MDCTDNWSKIKEIVQNTRFPAESNEIFLFGAGLIGALAASTL